MSYWRRAIKTRTKLFLHLHLEYILHTQKTHILSASSAPDSTHENIRDPQIQTVFISFILLCHADNSNKTQTLQGRGRYVVKEAKPSGIWHAEKGALSTFSSSLKGGLHLPNGSPRGRLREAAWCLHPWLCLPASALPDRLPGRQRERNEIRQSNGILLPPFHREAEFILFEKLNLLWFSLP